VSILFVVLVLRDPLARFALLLLVGVVVALLPGIEVLGVFRGVIKAAARVDISLFSINPDTWRLDNKSAISSKSP
jgi:hypothetical protein